MACTTASVTARLFSAAVARAASALSAPIARTRSSDTDTAMLPSAPMARERSAEVVDTRAAPRLFSTATARVCSTWTDCTMLAAMLFSTPVARVRSALRVEAMLFSTATARVTSLVTVVATPSTRAPVELMRDIAALIFGKKKKY